MARPPQDEQPGGFFANARRLARERTPKDAATPRTYVLRCPDCGAPRQGDDLSCRHCGGSTSE